MSMDPADVDSAADVRANWDAWSYDERVEALDALANATLGELGYDTGVTVDTGDVEGDYTGSYGGGDITLDPSLIEDPDPTTAIHETNHEMVHAMNEEDGVDDDTGWLHEPDGDMDFTDDEMAQIEAHTEVGEIARALDYDGAAPPGAAAPPGMATTAGGSEYEGASDAPQSNELSAEIDWASGVWIDTTSADGSYGVDIYFAPMEGW